jgi:hypothetical protein
VRRGRSEPLRRGVTLRVCAPVMGRQTRAILTREKKSRMIESLVILDHRNVITCATNPKRVSTAAVPPLARGCTPRELRRRHMCTASTDFDLAPGCFPF